MRAPSSFSQVCKAKGNSTSQVGEKSRPFCRTDSKPSRQASKQATRATSLPLQCRRYQTHAAEGFLFPAARREPAPGRRSETRACWLPGDRPQSLPPISTHLFASNHRSRKSRSRRGKVTLLFGGHFSGGLVAGKLLWPTPVHEGRTALSRRRVVCSICPLQQQ